MIRRFERKHKRGSSGFAAARMPRRDLDSDFEKIRKTIDKMAAPERWLGRTEFHPKDYTRAFGWMVHEFSIRVKWRAHQSAGSSTLQKPLTEPDIVRDVRDGC